MSTNAHIAASVKKVEDGLYELRSALGNLAAENARLRSGPSNRKKLTAGDVARIRDMARRTSLTQKALADMFDVSSPTISRIIRGVYWKG